MPGDSRPSGPGRVPNVESAELALTQGLLRDIFLAFIRLHLLHHACEGPIYGLEMIAELARHGYALSPGTLYPVLHALEEGGYLTSERQVVKGKVRRYYQATERGRQVLGQVRHQVRELVEEVLGEAVAG